MHGCIYAYICIDTFMDGRMDELMHYVQYNCWKKKLHKKTPSVSSMGPWSNRAENIATLVPTPVLISVAGSGSAGLVLGSAESKLSASPAASFTFPLPCLARGDSTAMPSAFRMFSLASAWFARCRRALAAWHLASSLPVTTKATNTSTPPARLMAPLFSSDVAAHVPSRSAARHCSSLLPLKAFISDWSRKSNSWGAFGSLDAFQETTNHINSLKNRRWSHEKSLSQSGSGHIWNAKNRGKTPLPSTPRGHLRLPTSAGNHSICSGPRPCQYLLHIFSKAGSSHPLHPVVFWLHAVAPEAAWHLQKPPAEAAAFPNLWPRTESPTWLHRTPCVSRPGSTHHSSDPNERRSPVWNSQCWWWSIGSSPCLGSGRCPFVWLWWPWSSCQSLWDHWVHRPTLPAFPATGLPPSREPKTLEVAAAPEKAHPPSGRPLQWLPRCGPAWPCRCEVRHPDLWRSKPKKWSFWFPWCI